MLIDPAMLTSLESNETVLSKMFHPRLLLFYFSFIFNETNNTQFVNCLKSRDELWKERNDQIIL